MKILERFAMHCLFSSVIRRTTVFADFLSLSEEAWAAVIKVLDKLAEPKQISDYPSVEGIHTLCISREQTAYIDALKSFINDGDREYFILRKLSKQLIKEITSIANTYFSIAEALGELSEAAKLATGGLEDQEMVEGATIYGLLNNLYFDIAETQMKKLTILQEHFTRYFYFSGMEIFEVREVYEKRKTIEDEFLKERTKVHLRKEKLLLEGNPARWEVPPDELQAIQSAGLSPMAMNERIFAAMLPKETEKLNALRDRCAFFNQRFLLEATALLMQKAQSTAQNFSSFSKLMSRNDLALQAHWSNLFNALTDSSFATLARGLKTSKGKK
eukprot:TRINITY_DN9360_c0_g1_i3.p1 TRINITY_DN9360_c0_g1~~TRINITY_DN9360_c0_g1_i3.p1  ORF type:complete len:330 (+),score=71.42 TRINITY_DN9360_c0_g1_i3:603-1592(+)